MKYLSENFFFFKVPFYLTVSLPFLLITGPFLADLAVSLSAILFLINYCLNPIGKYFNNYFFKFFLIFWITLIISSLFSSEVLYSLKSSFFYIRFGLFTISVFYLLDKSKKLIEYLFYVLIFCFIILIFDGYLQFFSNKNIFGWEMHDTRVSSFFKEELIMGSYLSRLFPIAFAFYIYLKLKKFTILICTIFILVEILIFISGERSAFLFINMSAIYMILMSKDFFRIRILIVISSLILITIISVFYDSRFKERMFDKTFNQIIITKNVKINSENNRIISQKKINIFSTEHENHYRSALLMFKDRPLFGVGPKLFRKLCGKEEYKISKDSCSTHPHNTYVQLLAESGIFSFLQILLILLIIIYHSFKHFYFKFVKKITYFEDYQLSLISALLITLWPIVPTGSFFTNWINIIYYLPAGFLIHSLQSQNKTK